MLDIAVFLCGAAVMILELVGARILAPYLGTSIVVWTGLIGVVLASLAVGAWWGGRLADRRPSARVLARLILLAAVLSGATTLTKAPLLGFLAGQGTGARLAVLAATGLLFAPAACLLGMVAPYAVRLRLTDPATAGATAGRLYALSTLGSIVGTFATGFYLLAALGNGAILLLVAGLLLAAALAVSRAEVRVVLAAAGLLAACGLGLAANEAGLEEVGIHDLDTAYGRVLVYQGPEPATGRLLRVLSTGPVRVQSAMYPDDPEALPLSYTRFFRLGPLLVPEVRRVLVLGGGAYSFPRHLLAARPGLAVTVVELDPGITDLARRYFGLTDTPGLTIVHEDARTFINRDGGPYDLIYLDAFGTDYGAPFHLVSREAVARLRALLAPGGAVVVNAISTVSGPGARFTRALAATFAAVFPEVALFALEGTDRGATPQNIQLTARTAAGALPVPDDPELRRFLANRLPEAAVAGGMVFTDEFAPVEWLSLALWRDAIR